jgi:hypothetical protein
MKRHLLGTAAAVLGTMLIGGVVVSTTVASAAAIPTTVTLPVFGVPLTIDITTGPGGALASVTVDPADNTTATQLRPHKVVFQSADPANPTGDPARVVVSSKKGGQSVSARAGSLAQISGPGMWSGDVFGDGVTTTTVNFTIAGDATTGPNITGTTSSDATAVIGAVEQSTQTNADGSTEMSARQSVKFMTAAGDMSRTLTIKAEVETDADATTHAKLSVSLGGIKGVAVAAAAAAGPHTWSGTLCDGTAATITYDVATDGSVSNVVATPTADVKVEDGKIDARFSHDERVRIRVREDNGLIKISIDDRIKCDSPNPTTNVSTSIPADNNNNNENHHGGHGNDDNNASTTTAVTTTTVA